MTAYASETLTFLDAWLGWILATILVIAWWVIDTWGDR